MKRTIYILFLLILFSCNDALFNEGSIITQNIDINDFDEIYVEDIFEIYLIQDTICKIEAKGGSNLLPNLIFNVDVNKRLTISNNNSANWSRDYNKIELYISVDTLKYLRINEPSQVISKNTLITPELTLLSIADFAEIELELDCNHCYVVNSGTSGGAINLMGKTNSFSFWARASLQLNAENFYANSISVKSESIGDCRINVSKELSVEILKSGNVYYKGDPEIIKYVNENARNKLIKMD